MQTKVANTAGDISVDTGVISRQVLKNSGKQKAELKKRVTLDSFSS
jgi:uncharacterized protein YijF (DUF1287 family)